VLTKEQLAEIDEYLNNLSLSPEQIHNLCHNLENTVSAEEFAKGCEDYQMKLFGRCPTAEKIKTIKNAVKLILPDVELWHPIVTGYGKIYKCNHCGGLLADSTNDGHENDCKGQKALQVLWDLLK
jgi:hypothetical protein